MSKRTIAALAFCSLAFASPAFAAGCDTAPNQNLANTCAEDAYKAVTAKINAIYKRVLAKYDPEGQALLRQSERAWIAYRDAECAFRNSGNAGGSIWPMVHFGCLTALTEARIKDLEAAENCEPGDLSCRQTEDAAKAAD
ncbi:MAG: DUF1311 domain-containing protein [Proteobacteria bacterium]|nr:DUF1311 domain-containing protein [Pseudomonadota bacterium]